MDMTVLLTLAVVALIIVARFVFGIVARLEGYSLTYETVKNDNPAIGIRYASFLIAIIFSFLGILHPSGVSWQADLNLIAQFGLLAIGLLVVSRWVNDIFLLYDFNNNKEVLTEKNTAVAIVEGATYLATAFIMVGALAGWEGGVLVSLIWFVIGQFFLVVLGLLYSLWRGKKAVHNELDIHNNACAFSMAGFMLSGGLALGAAISGPFTGWSKDLKDVVIYLLVWLAFMLVAALITNILVLPGRRLKHEIMKDKNTGAGLIEAAVFLAVTLFYIKVA
jgi:hypothetical protein